MSDHDRFGELRAHLEEYPGPEPFSFFGVADWKIKHGPWWADLLLLLDSWGDQNVVREEVVPYVVSSLEKPWRCLPHTEWLNGAYRTISPEAKALRERFFHGAEIGWASFISELALDIRDENDEEVSSPEFYGDRPADTFSHLAAGHNISKIKLFMMAHSYQPEAVRLFGDPTLSKVESLEVNLQAVRGHLRNSNNALEAFDALANNPGFAGLTNLYLADNCIGDDALRALASSPHLRNIVHLNLGGHEGEAGNFLGDAGVAALAASPVLATVQSLDLGWNESLGPDGLQALLDSPYLERLGSLNLSITAVGEQGVRALAAWGQDHSLDSLEIIVSDVSDEAWEMLEASPGFEDCDITK